jgi:uncharacterized protein YegL
MFFSSEIHVIILLDVSYSMSAHINDFVYALNNFIKKLRNVNDSYMLTIGEFNTQLNFITEYQNVESIKEFSSSDFKINGTTALYDAICNTIKFISRNTNIKAKKTKMFIITDGDDNASFVHNKEDTDRLTNDAINFGGWEITHCHTDSNLLNIPTVTYDVNNIMDIFENLKI